MVEEDDGWQGWSNLFNSQKAACMSLNCLCESCYNLDIYS